MEIKVFFRNIHYVLQFICICFLFFTPILWFYKLRIPLIREKTWLCLRLVTLPCSLSKECSIFNLTCYSNGKIIFYGINNTAYIGKKMFQLPTNRIIFVHEFIQTHSFKSDIEPRNILFHLELSYNNSEKYFWRNDSISYTILTSILTVDKLASYKRWSVLFRTGHMLSNIRQRKQSEHLVNVNSKQSQTKQRLKRSIKAQHSINSNPLIIPTTQGLSMINNNDDKIPVYYIVSNVRSIRSTGLVTTKFDDDFCFSSQVTISTFDLVDACLSTNDIIGDNQFYPLREQFIWPNDLIDLQGKFDVYFRIGY